MAALVTSIVVLVIISSLAFHTHCSASKSSSSGLFVFGDSFFDPGNNNFINTTTDFQANFPPYGESFFKYPTGRFCDGRVIPDFIAEYAKLPLIPPFLGESGLTPLGCEGLNFASGGAGALDQTFEGKVISLRSQFKFFKKAVKKLSSHQGKEEAKQVVSNAVYLINIGANDYLFPLSTNSSLLSSLTPQQYTSMVVASITKIIRGIYKQGGRKFAVVNQGPLGCLPGLRALSLSAGGDGSCLNVATDLATLHNALLSEKLQYLNQILPGFKYSHFDFFKTALQVLANPLQYGFKEAESACCGSGPFRGLFSCGGKRGVAEFELCSDPSHHLFFDSDHPTQAANLMLSKLFWAGPSNLVGPYNLEYLFQLAV